MPISVDETKACAKCGLITEDNSVLAGLIVGEVNL